MTYAEMSVSLLCDKRKTTRFGVPWKTMSDKCVKRLERKFKSSKFFCVLNNLSGMVVNAFNSIVRFRRFVDSAKRSSGICCRLQRMITCSRCGKCAKKLFGSVFKSMRLSIRRICCRFLLALNRPSGKYKNRLEFKFIVVILMKFSKTFG